MLQRSFRSFCKIIPKAEATGPLKRLKQKLGRKVIFRILTALSISGVIFAVSLRGMMSNKTKRDNKDYVQPSEVLELGVSGNFQLSFLVGVVKQGSFRLDRGSLKHHFVLTDFIHEVQVHYTGVMPLTFREGETARVHGDFVDPYNPVEFIASLVEGSHDSETPKTAYKPRSRDIDIQERSLAK